MRTKSITSVILLFVMLIAAFLFVGCDDRQKISFIVDGRVYETVRTSGYETIEMPESPVKDGYVFDDWYWNTDWDSTFGENAFKHEALTVNLKVYARFVKEDASSITNVTLSNSLKKIEARQFEDYSSLESITIPKSVKTIGENAFWGCSSLTRINITDLESWCKIEFENIYSNPLFYAKNLCLNGELVTDLVIPNKLKKINDFTFCSGSFTTISIPNSVEEIGAQTFFGCTEFKSLTIPDSVEKICREAFKDCIAIESVAMGNSVTEVEGNAFQSCNAIKRIDITNIENWLNINFKEPYSNPLESAHALYLNGNLVTDLVIPDSVLQIQNYSFKDYTDLKSVVIGNGVTWIDQEAFDGCTSLESVVIGNSVEIIGTRAFNDCTALQSVKIENSVTKIYDSAFKNCAIKTLTIPNSVTDICEEAFSGCEALEILEMGNSVINIENEAFEDCNSLKRVNINDIAGWCKIEFDGSYSNPLYYTKNLYLNDTLLTNLVIPNGVTEIKKEAFCDCESLQSVIIPNSVKIIGEDAFNRCIALKNVTIGNSVEIIGEHAFCNCLALKSIKIPDSVKRIGEYAFSSCETLKFLDLGSVHAIASGAFVGCPALTEVIIPVSLTSLFYRSFFPDQVYNIYYLGTETQWSNLEYYFENDNIYFYSETQPTTAGNFWHWVDDKPTIWASSN